MEYHLNKINCRKRENGLLRKTMHSESLTRVYLDDHIVTVFLYTYTKEFLQNIL